MASVSKQQHRAGGRKFLRRQERLAAQHHGGLQAWMAASSDRININCIVERIQYTLDSHFHGCTWCVPYHGNPSHSSHQLVMVVKHAGLTDVAQGSALVLWPAVMTQIRPT